jgi:RHS repeat-associated protein
VEQITDPASKATDYQHDDFGRLVKVTSPNTGVTLFLYDAGGNLVTRKEDLAGTPRTTSYSYDGLDRLTAIDLPSDPDWTFTYDGSATLNQKGRLSAVTNGIVTTEREYTDRGELALERTTIGGTSYAVAYSYDASGSPSSIQTPSAVTTAYAYSGGRPKTVTVTAGAEQQVVRNIAFGPFSGRTYAEFPPYDSGSGQNTVVSTRTYNLRGQVGTLQVIAPSSIVLDQSLDYAYTAGGAGPVDPGPNLDRVIDNRDAGESRFFFYDDLDRLWKATDLTGTPIQTYIYDANGNRTQESAPTGTTTYSYETATDRLAQASGAGAKHYANDAYGNRIWAGPVAYAGLSSHIYDEEMNRLVEVRDPVTQSVLAQYSYDAFGRRVRKITPSGTTLFFYDDADHLIESRSLAQTPNPTRTYVWLEDEPIGAVDQGAGPTRFTWIHTNHLGTPLAATSAPATGGAEVIWRASYAPFGQATVDEDPDGDLQTFTLDLRFPGQVYDAESGLAYNFFRTYDSATGRYLQADPIGQWNGVNLYGYVGNDPLGGIDPLGLFDPYQWTPPRVEGTLDFVQNYLASGRPVDLGESQLGDTYQNSPSVGSALGGFSASINRAAREAVKAACGRCTRGKKRITFGISDMLSTNVTTQPGLFSLGQSSGLRAGASCNVTVDCTTGVYSYICDAGLNLKDDFTDPLDGDRIIGRPFDLPRSTPYPITYSFKVRRSGGGAIPR